MGWRDRLNLLTTNARLAWQLRSSKHDEEKIRFARHPSQDQSLECHAMRNGSTFSKAYADSAVHRNGGSLTDDKTKSYRENGDNMDCQQDDLFLEEAEIGGDPRDKITEWQAGWNVTNAIQGMFIVSFPYTVLQGGYWAVFAMVLVAYICCHTGNILVDCLYDLDPLGHKVRVRSSYVDIAAAVWGARFGARIVHCAQLIELLMTCILYVLLCGDLIQGSIPSSVAGGGGPGLGGFSLTCWILVCTAPLLACAFLTSLRRVSTLSMWCTVAHMLINAIVLIYCFTKVREWRWRDVQVRIDIWTFPISLGIIVFSYTSQIFLPSLEGKLRDRRRFRCMMTWTHLAAAIFKALFSYVGFLTWGLDTMEVVTNNLPSTGLKLVVNFILVCKAMLSYPLPYFASVELLETAFFQGRPKTCFPTCFEKSEKGEDNNTFSSSPFSGSSGNTRNQRHLTWWGLSLRLALVLFTAAMAISVPHFALLMGFIGSFTGTMLSFVWPCYFHLRLRWYAMSRLSRALDIMIIVLGVVFGSIGIYYSGHALNRAFHGLPPRPTIKYPVQ
ncbi:vesicular inhibitory amino acid transporter-like [Elysia marginata]|uniref:Vesicular inhibitory amino acid transporter-like n=1 Tax=Elysia marginata TaxID=1093978 RepID=A0AAV4GYM3_9GAST|nr:vesicular inhibitory amino acid transporter-like [Elysia marginata]